LSSELIGLLSRESSCGDQGRGQLHQPECRFLDIFHGSLLLRALKLATARRAASVDSLRLPPASIWKAAVLNSVANAENESLNPKSGEKSENPSRIAQKRFETCASERTGAEALELRE
jgi:hypothetical protein